MLRAQPHYRQQLGDPIAQRPPTRDLVDRQRLADDPPDRHARIERREWILEDHLHVGADLGELLRIQLLHLDLAELRIVERYLAGGRIIQANNRAAGGALAAAALADQAECFALLDEQIDTVDGLDLPDNPPEKATMNREVLFEAFHIQENIVGLSILADGLTSSGCSICSHGSPSMRNGSCGPRLRSKQCMSFPYVPSLSAPGIVEIALVVVVDAELIAGRQRRIIFVAQDIPAAIRCRTYRSR